MLITVKLSPEAHKKLKVATALTGANSYSEYLEKNLPEVKQV